LWGASQESVRFLLEEAGTKALVSHGVEPLEYKNLSETTFIATSMILFPLRAESPEGVSRESRLEACLDLKPIIEG
jgi:hypothetical protein